MTMQNKIALDMFLIAHGGTCAIIGKECCIYIPENSEEIHDVAQQIRRIAVRYHDNNK